MQDYWSVIKSFYTSEYLENNCKTKAGLIQKVFESVSHIPGEIFFATYNPVAELLADSFNVTVNEDYATCVVNSNIKLAPFDDSKTYDTVILLDEYLTYLATEQEQKDCLELISKITKGWAITTLADYKNLAPYKKNQVESSLDTKHNKILIEHHVASAVDKQAWQTYFHTIEQYSKLTTIGPYDRRTMYFKQLAKYTADLGAQEYVVQKNILYKGFGKKNWEHVITVRF